MANIYDVAEKAGVSIATVSRVLNSPNKVAQETRKNIHRAMEELNFQRFSAQDVHSRKNIRRIGVFSPFSSAYSFLERQLGISKYLLPSRYEMIVYSMEGTDQLDSYLEILPRIRRVHGLILLSLPFPKRRAKAYKKFGIPVVSVERDLSDLGISSVVVNNPYGGRLAADYLLAKGYRRFAFVGYGGNSDYVYSAAALRLQGFRERLEEAGVLLSEEDIRLHYFGLDYAYQAALELIDRPQPPEAIFTASDFEAVVLQKAIRDRGLRIPGDIALLGFDNIELAEFLDISTIDQHLAESGRTAVEMIVHQMNHPDRISRRVQLNLQVVERSTT